MRWNDITEAKEGLHNKFWINVKDGREIDSNPEHNKFVLTNQELFGINFDELIPEKIREKILTNKPCNAQWFGLITKKLGEQGWVRGYFNTRSKEIAVDAVSIRDAHKAAKRLADKLGEVKQISIDIELSEASSEHYILYDDFMGFDEVEYFLKRGKVMDRRQIMKG